MTAVRKSVRRLCVLKSQPLFSEAAIQNWTTGIEKIVDLLWGDGLKTERGVELLVQACWSRCWQVLSAIQSGAIGLHGGWGCESGGIAGGDSLAGSKASAGVTWKP